MAIVAVSSLAGQTRYDLLVSSRGTSAVKRFDGETGQFLDDFVPSGTGGLSLTQEVRQGPNGHILVTGRGNTAVLQFDRRTGVPLGSFTTGYSLDQPTKTTFLPDGRLYISQWGTTKSTVAVFDGTTGTFLQEGTPPLNQPMQHLLDPSGNLLVVSFGSRDVRRFNPSGGPLGTVTSGKDLQGPVNLWRHSSGDLLVMDWQAGTVERFDGATGAFKSTFISGLTNAEGWAIGPDGGLYVADWSRNVILRFDAETGAARGAFASGGGLNQPNSLLFVERTPDFRLSLTPQSIQVRAGQIAMIEAVVTADRGLAFPGAVTLACGGLPTGWTCSFDRSTASPGAAADTIRLGIQTTGSTRATGSIAGLGGLALVFVVGAVRARRRPRLAIPVGLSLAVACGGVDPSPGPTPVTAVVTVVGTGDGLQRAAAVQVTAAP